MHIFQGKIRRYLTTAPFAKKKNLYFFFTMLSCFSSQIINIIFFLSTI